MVERNRGGYAFQTPREFCAGQGRAMLFHRRKEDYVPTWRKIGRGLIAVTDGSAEQYVYPDFVFGVEIIGGNRPAIFSYWRDDGGNETKRQVMRRPYRLSTVTCCAGNLEMVRVGAPMSYKEMVEMVTQKYPTIYVPTIEEWAETYNIGCSTSRGTFYNIHNYKKECDV